jgi:hypothetical protein
MTIARAVMAAVGGIARADRRAGWEQTSQSHLRMILRTARRKSSKKVVFVKQAGAVVRNVSP